MTSKLPKIKKCACGCKAELWRFSDGLRRVACTRFLCWQGPGTDKSKTAILAWNRVMGQVKHGK
jgi:hypothetical protein